MPFAKGAKATPTYFRALPGALCGQVADVMRSNSRVDTLVNFIVQAICVFLWALAVVTLGYEYVKAALSISGLASSYDSIDGRDGSVLVLVGLIWCISQAKMLLLIIKNKGKFNIASENYQDEFLAVLHPVLWLFALSIFLVVATIPGFVVAGILNIWTTEIVALSIGSIVAVAVLGLLLKSKDFDLKQRDKRLV